MIIDLCIRSFSSCNSVVFVSHNNLISVQFKGQLGYGDSRCINCRTTLLCNCIGKFIITGSSPILSHLVIRVFAALRYDRKGEGG